MKNWHNGDVVILTGNGVMLFRSEGRWKRDDNDIVVLDRVVDHGRKLGWAVQLVDAKAVRKGLTHKRRPPK